MGNLRLLYDMLLSFFIYGFLGWCAEVAFAATQEKRFVNRGFLNGPICPIYGIGVTVVIIALEPYAGNLAVLYVVSALLVTALEWATGLLLEKIFHHKWWDYSDRPLNIQGYISLLWGAACVLIVKGIHPALYKAALLIPVWLGSAFLTVLCAALAADTYVTASGILKLNHRLDHMREIAEELHDLSDQLGENIYQNMMAWRSGSSLRRRRKSCGASTKRCWRARPGQAAGSSRHSPGCALASMRSRLQN